MEMKNQKMQTAKQEKLKIREAVIVEGRDDTAAVKQAADCIIIETHGFGIKREIWLLIEKAYNENGLIIFTDPDYSGEEIRRKLTARFPEARQAFLSRNDALKNGDIGIENASPQAIREALLKAHCTSSDSDEIFIMSDLDKAGLTGGCGSKERRQQLGRILGIGYGNSKTLLDKLNKFGITREEFEDAVKQL